LKIKLITAPTIEPVDQDSLANHLRLDLTASDTDDTTLDELVLAAREHVEDVTRRALLTQTWDYSLDGWPDENYIRLPFGNLQSVTSIKYKDTAGTETTMAVTTEYLVETNGEDYGRIVLPYGVSWPSTTLYPSNPITIRFVCGWTAAADVPSKIKTAIKMRAADPYQERGDPVKGLTVTENKTIRRLLENARLWGEF